MTALNIRQVSDDPNNSHLAYNNHIGPFDRFMEVLNKDSKGVRDKSVFLNYVAAVALVTLALQRGATAPHDEVSLKNLFYFEVTRLRDEHSSLDRIIEAICQLIAKHGHSESGQAVVLKLLPELGSLVRPTQDRR